MAGQVTTPGAAGTPASDEADRGPRAIEPGLIVRGLSKAYGRHRVLDALDLSIPAATLTAVVGSNGAGKSTLLGCVADALRHEGSIHFGGSLLRAIPGQMAYLPQRIRLPGGATVDEVLALFRALAGPSPDRVAAPEGFVPAGHRRIAELSGGQAQRVALAGTLFGAPRLLLLDEPHANLDDPAKDSLRNMLAAHRDAGATILVASPAAFDLLANADLVVRVEAGQVVYHGPAAAFLAGLPATVWVDLESGKSAGDIAGIALVTRTRMAGHWAALECRDQDVAMLLATLADRGVGVDRIRIAGPGDADLSALPPDGTRESRP